MFSVISEIDVDGIAAAVLLFVPRYVIQEMDDGCLFGTSFRCFASFKY